MKHCPRCKKKKPASAFNKNSRRYDGRQSYCRKCQRKYQNKLNKNRTKKDLEKVYENRNINRNRNRAYVVDILTQTPCMDCGESNPVVLDFDHVRGKKFKNISTLVHMPASLKRLKEEIAKCEVVCANCHRVRETIRNKSHWAHSML